MWKVYDDRRLQVVRQQRLEAERPHAVDQAPGRSRRSARRVRAAPPSAQNSFSAWWNDDDDVDRRREAVLPGLVEVLPLVVQIEHQRRRIALGLGQRRLAADDEAEARNALDALVGRRGDGVEPASRRTSSGSAPNALMASSRKRRPCVAARAPISSIGLQDAAGRLAMDREDMGDGGVRLEHRARPAEIGRRVLRRLVHDDGAASDLENLPGALAIGAVDQQQDLAGRRHEGGQHRLDGERAGALHRHGDVSRGAMHDFGQPLQHRLD